ncbi:MAG TPA: glycoside hydrolase family 28 protein [bacterium]|nr:glycoside hydrolase family 28 protein [bacterium]
MNQNKFQSLILLITLSTLIFLDVALANHLALNFFNVRDFGAAGQGTDCDTEAVQAAIDSAFANGGGVVYFPPGKYLIKTVVLKDNVAIRMDRGTTILGSTELNQFDPQYGSFTDSDGRKFGTCLFFARDAKNIAIEGDGIINGQGFPEFYPIKEGLARPAIIRFIRCQNVKIEDIMLINSAAWVQHYVECDDLTIRGITVHSYSNKNNDGLDIEGCQRVLITGCNISSEDDSIVLKAFSRRSCRDVVISDCIISGLKSAIKTGTESAGGFENISISNCVFYGTRGISLLSVDGGDVNNITISNISMRDSYAVIVMRLGARMRPFSLSEEERPQKAGTFKNIMIHNIQATGVTESNDFICGIPGHFIENVTLSNIRITYKGGGNKVDSERAIPELVDEYPKAKMFGTLPAYGFFIRHAKNIKLTDVSLSFEKPDHRSVIWCDDVSNLELAGIQAQSTATAVPFFSLKNVRDAWIHGCKPLNAIETFLRVDGSDSEGIILSENFLKSVRTEIVQRNEVAKHAVESRGNFK